MKGRNVIIQLAIVTGILVVVNLLSSKLYFRGDFTEDQRYTLSTATKDILEDLPEVVTVKAYFSEDLPTQLVSTRQDFEDLLLEYENRSDGYLVYEFLNPNENEQKEQEAQQAGVNPVMVNVREKDQMKQMRAYLGAIIQMGDRKEIIPLIQPGAAMEYALTTAIKKIAIADKPKIGLIQGHGEAPLEEMIELYQQLSVLYEIEPFGLSDSAAVPQYYRSLAWINPKDTIPQADFAKLDKYLANGGAMFVAYSNLNGDLSQAYLSTANDIGVSSWLSRLGIQMGREFVVDAENAPVSVRQQMGQFTMNRQIAFPYFPIIKNFSDHPASKGLESVFLPFASTINFTKTDTTFRSTSLLMTSELSGLVSPPTTVDIQRQWTENDFQNSSLPVAMAVEGPLSGTASSKMVVVSNGQFIINGPQGQQQQLNADNVSFASNAIDWLSDDTGLIDLRTKGVTARPLVQLEDSTKELLKYGNVLLPILLLLIYAFVRKQRNNRKRQQWAAGNY
ncbi:Gldg family protein [uncultured Imperialibacter sp.]|uniref:GldG family protein n=1 Tax=uncultured Imperialibacter sp. TaxID=1672639 RepID=UPI0030DA7F9C|tara:strand:+ start:4899 stop:6416 length:1518 start_codon:yes stop_codon:yes gene_type:complete